LPHSFTEEIEKVMRQAGKTLNERLPHSFTEGIELPNSSEIKVFGNRLLNEEPRYNKEEKNKSTRGSLVILTPKS
jgi:hypothetical protein